MIWLIEYMDNHDHLNDFYSKNESRLVFLHEKLCGEIMVKVDGKYYTRSKGSWLLSPICIDERTLGLINQVIVYRPKEMSV